MYLEGYTNEISELCRKNSVKVLYAFGSVTTRWFADKSDIDLIVDIDSADPLEYADNYFNLKFSLESLLQRQIDLLEQKALKNKYLIEKINQTKILIYEA